VIETLKTKMKSISYKSRKRFSEDEMFLRSKVFYKMMEVRRSVRKFSSKKIPRRVIENIIKTAGTSPSGANCQPWRFVVVSNPEIKHLIRIEAEKIEKENYEKRFTNELKNAIKPLGTDWHKEFLETAPYLIVVFQIIYNENDSQRKKNYYVKESVGIAVGILITAIHNAGLFALTYTPSSMRFLNKILNRPKNEKPFMIIPTGYSSYDIEIPDIKRKTLDEISIFID